MEKLPKKYIFIDESGDAAFYAKGKKLLIGTDGFKPLLVLGMIMCDDKKHLHQAVTNFQNQLLNDALYNTLPCITKSNQWFLHARNDQLEVRAKFIELLRNITGFESYHVIGRKKLNTFQSKHNSNENEFYFDLVYHLLKDRLNNENYFYQIFLAARNGNTANLLKAAIDKAIAKDNHKRENKLNIKFDCRIVQTNQTPEMSIVDYLLWSLQRHLLSDEARYYKALENKYNLIIDLYSTADNNYYTAQNRFNKNEAAEFRNDGK